MSNYSPCIQAGSFSLVQVKLTRELTLSQVSFSGFQMYGYCKKIIVAACSLKTLFNIVEALFKQIVEFSRVWCVMMFRWTNKQPGIQKF